MVWRHCWRCKGTDVDHFISYLHTTISERTKKPFGTGGQRVILNTLKSIIRWCQLHRPNDVPVTEIFTGNEYIGVNRKLKIDFIPDDVVAQINEALKTEENPYLKYGIIILQSTGMRIGDLLKLRIEGAIYGEHYAEHFIPTIEVLKFIIERLEGLQNGN